MYECMNEGMIGFLNIRERRTTRNMGVDRTAHRRVIKGLTLPPNHQFSDEAILYRDFMEGIRAIPGTVQDPEKPWISTSHGAFYQKLVIYKNDKRFREDPVRHMFPLTSATTQTTAFRDITDYLQSSSRPIAFFLGQQENPKRDAEGHCWAVFVWQASKDERRMAVKDSNTGSFAKVSQWTRNIAKWLKIETINLIPATPEDNTSDDQCVDLTYLAIADFLDGNFSPLGEHKDQRIWDVSSNEWQAPTKRKRKAEVPITGPSTKVLRERN
jgi:hypothetical protein